MKMMRMAALIAAAAAAASKAKEYARQNPEQATQTLDKVEAFVAAKAGPKYVDKVGKGGAALRASLGLSARAGGTPGPTGPGATGAGPTGAGPVAPASSTPAGAEATSPAGGDGSGTDVPPRAFDPSI